MTRASIDLVLYIVINTYVYVERETERPTNKYCHLFVFNQSQINVLHAYHCFLLTNCWLSHGATFAITWRCKSVQASTTRVAFSHQMQYSQRQYYNSNRHVSSNSHGPFISASVGAQPVKMGRLLPPHFVSAAVSDQSSGSVSPQSTTAPGQRLCKHTNRKQTHKQINHARLKCSRASACVGARICVPAPPAPAAGCRTPSMPPQPPPSLRRSSQPLQRPPRQSWSRSVESARLAALVRHSSTYVRHASQ